MLNYEPELGMKGVIEPARVPESNTQQARFEKIHTHCNMFAATVKQIHHNVDVYSGHIANVVSADRQPNAACCQPDCLMLIA